MKMALKNPSALIIYAGRVTVSNISISLYEDSNLDYHHVVPLRIIASPW